MDREKVIKGATICKPSKYKRICSECPYREEMNCDYVLYHDVLDMLKEQKAEIRQLRLALDIAKGTCNGIKVEGR